MLKIMFVRPLINVAGIWAPCISASGKVFTIRRRASYAYVYCSRLGAVIGTAFFYLMLGKVNLLAIIPPGVIFITMLRAELTTENS